MLRADLGHGSRQGASRFRTARRSAAGIGGGLAGPRRLRSRPRLFLSLVPGFGDRHRRVARGEGRGVREANRRRAFARICRVQSSAAQSGRARASRTRGASGRKFSPPSCNMCGPTPRSRRSIGDAALAEARVNPDGTLDFTRWARPQNDGPALRVLALKRWRDARTGLGRGAATGHAGACRLAIWTSSGHARESLHSTSGRRNAGIIIIRSSYKPKRSLAAPNGLRKSVTTSRAARLPLHRGRACAEPRRLLERG